MIRFPDIQCDGHAGIYQGVHRLQLRLPQEGGIRIIPIFERRDLHVVEREVTLPPTLAPSVGHRRDQVGITVRTVAVGLALIPDRATDCVAFERMDHGIVENRRMLLNGQIRRRFQLEPEWLQGRAIGPRLGGRSAPASHDDTDWHIQLLLELLGEEIGGRRPGNGSGCRPHFAADKPCRRQR